MSEFATYYTCGSAADLLGIHRQVVHDLKVRGVFNPPVAAHLMIRSKREPLFTAEDLREWHARYRKFSAKIAGARSKDREHVRAMQEACGLTPPVSVKPKRVRKAR